MPAANVEKSTKSKFIPDLCAALRQRYFIYVQFFGGLTF
jgi:hypothetical protein